MHHRHLKPVATRTIAPLIGVLMMLFALSASGADDVDAQGLLEQHCSSCHGSEMYTREDSQGQVVQWPQEAGGSLQQQPEYRSVCRRGGRSGVAAE